MVDICKKLKKDFGGPAALAKALADLSGEPISSQAVSQWKKVPPDRVLDVERITGISRHELRPDVFGAGESAA
jgi:DNA-binding transcriptional regulator YdaS (Cro superfamily)